MGWYLEIKEWEKFNLSTKVTEEQIFESRHIEANIIAVCTIMKGVYKMQGFGRSHLRL
jgi:hypothetical protein